MSRAPLLLLLAYAATVHALSLPDLSARLANGSIPESVEFRTTTTAEVGSQVLITKTHLIQAGPQLQWMETEAGGRRLRMVRNGARMQMTDLATGASQIMAAPQNLDQLAMVRDPLAGGDWLAPVAVGDGLWKVADTSARNGVRSQFFLFSEHLNQIVEMSRVGLGGDTTRMVIHWNVVQGRQLLEKMELIVRASGQTSRVGVIFSGWLFPRSLPPDLFDIR